MFYCFLRGGGIFANVRLHFLGGKKQLFFFPNEYLTTNDPLLQQEFVISIKGIRLFCHRFHPVAADPPEITGRALRASSQWPLVALQPQVLQLQLWQ